MELILSTDLDKSLPATIDFNHEAILAQLDEKLVKYNGLIVTEDAIKEAKKDKASLNQLKESIENWRKGIKNQCLAPYLILEAKTKEIVAKIDEPIKAIDGQIKSFEEEARAKKASEIMDIYNANIGDYAEILPFGAISNLRWMNVTYSMKDIEKEVKDVIFKVKNDLKVITAFNTEYELQIKDVYLRTLDFSSAMAEKTRLEEQAKKLKKVEPVKEPVPANEVEWKAEPVIYSEPAPVVAEEIKTIQVEFFNTTVAFRKEMRELTEKHNIKYGGIK